MEQVQSLSQHEEGTQLVFSHHDFLGADQYLKGLEKCAAQMHLRGFYFPS